MAEHRNELARYKPKVKVKGWLNQNGVWCYLARCNGEAISHKIGWQGAMDGAWAHLRKAHHLKLVK